MAKTLILGSTSPFRKEILDKLNIEFQCDKPDIDESEHADESPTDLVKRLAIEKAQVVATKHNNSLIIGSDQVAVCDGEILGKPHTVENAVKQLSKFSNKAVTFYTGLAVVDSATTKVSALVEPFIVHFNPLTEQDIRRYIAAEMPLHCAGSFKSEGLGICLFKKLEGDDPNTLIGLPLIKLVSLLKEHGFDVLAQQK